MNLKSTHKTVFLAIFFPLWLAFSSFQGIDEHPLFMDIEGVERSFLIKLSHGYEKNLPMIIVLHQNGTSPSRLAGINWQRLDHNAIVAFPSGIGWQWSCHVDNNLPNKINNDILFIDRLITKFQNDFSIDSSRIYIVGAGDSYCLAEQFQQRITAKVHAVRWDEKKSSYSSNNSNKVTLPIPLVNHEYSEKVPGEIVREPKPDTSEYTKANTDFLHLKYQISPFNNQGVKGTIKTVDFGLKYPITNKSKYQILGRIGYEALWAQKQIVFDVAVLQSLSAQFFLNKNVGKSMLTAFVGTGIYSDFKDVSGKDFRFSSGARFKRKVSARFSFSYGLSYNRQFLGNQIIPFVEIDYWINERTRIFGPFPIRPKIEMKVAPAMIIGAGIYGDGSNYRLSSVFDDDQVIQINQWGMNLYAKKKLYKAISFYASIGHSIRRSLKLYDDAVSVPWTIITIPLNDKAVPIERISNNSYTLDIGLSFGLYEHE